MSVSGMKDEEDTSNRNVKIIFLAVMFVVTTFFCFLPKILLHYGSKTEGALDIQQARKLRRRKRLKKILLSLTNCFASGVFLGVCLLDLLPEVEENFENFFKTFPHLTSSFPTAQFCVVFGFLILITIEQMANLCRKDNHFHSHAHQGGPESLMSSTASTLPPSRGDYDSFRHRQHHHLPHNYMPITEAEPQLLGAERNECRATLEANGQGDDVIVGVSEDSPLLQSSTSAVAQCGDSKEEKEEMTNIIEDLEEAEIERTEVPTDPAARSQVRYVMLAIALSVHSIFEGLALGLLSKLSSVVQLFAAISIHKCIVAFSLGINIAQSDLSKVTQLVSMVVFCLASPIGTLVGLGIEMVKFTDGVAGAVVGSLQGLACGSFIYVVFFELLPHEFFTHKRRPSPLLKVVALTTGIALMSVVMMIAPV